MFCQSHKPNTETAVRIIQQEHLLLVQVQCSSYNYLLLMLPSFLRGMYERINEGHF